MSGWFLFYLISVLIIIVADCILLKKIKKMRKEEEAFLRPTPPSRELIDKAMKELNTNIIWAKDEGFWKGHFTYLNTKFRIRLAKDRPIIVLYYPSIFETPVTHLETVRALCNQCNIHSETCRMVYTVNDLDAVVNVHVLCDIMLGRGNTANIIKRTLDRCFAWHKDFVARFNSECPEGEDGKQCDPEKDGAITCHEIFLIREMEMRHQDDGPNWHDSPDDPLCLRRLTAVTMDLHDLVPLALTVFQDDHTSHYDGFNEMMDFRVAEPLIADNKFHHDNAVMRLDFYDPRNAMVLRHLIVDLQSQGCANGTLYYRATLCLAPAPMDKDIPMNNSDTRKLTTSVLLGYDTTNGQKAKEQFDYMWKEIRAKVKNGQENKLTADETALLSLQGTHVDEVFIKGRNVMAEKRYYEAWRCLESVIDSLLPLKTTMQNNLTEVFYKTCYLVGTCYVCLRQYRKAEYFLQITLPSRTITYTEMYINALVGMHDFRALSFINELINGINAVDESMSDGEDAPKEKHGGAFMSFLERRKAYLLIDMARYDEAESLLKPMLNEPYSCDFALQELAYIQKKKGK